MRHYVSALGILLLAGCYQATALRPEARYVWIAPTTFQGCMQIGYLTGTSRAESQREAVVGAQNDLRNQAFAIGANVVTIQTNNSDSLWSPATGWMSPAAEVTMTGVAFRCAPPAQTPQR